MKNSLSVRKVNFTDHALRKFEILKRLGLSISVRRVVRVVENPVLLNKEHVLRVVYEKVGDRKLVVTFYPASRKRFEG